MTIPRSTKENSSSSSSTSTEFVKVSSPIPVSSHKKFDDRHRRSLRRSSRFEKQSIRLRRGKSAIILNLLSSKSQSEDGQDENENDDDDDINPRRKRIRKQLISGDNDQVMLMCNSSDTSSPSYSFFTNQSSFDLFYDTTDIDSISADSASFFLSVDGSKINPIEDACLVLHESSENLVLQGKEGASTDKDEIVVWLVNSPKSSTNDLVQVGNSDDILSHVLNSNETLSKTANDIQEVDTDGPLFWPSERKLEWSSSDKWDLIVISPRKNGDIVISSPRKNGEIVISPHKNGEIVISPRENGKIVITPRKNGDIVITPRRNGGKPQGTSGLARSNSSVRFSFNKRKTEVKVDEPKKKILSRSKSEVSAAQLEGKLKAENKMKSKLLEIINENNPFFGGLLEESDCIVPSNDVSIEKLVGLNEFDGHEGVEGDNSNKGDYFFLDVTNGISRNKSNILKYSRSSSQKERSERKRSRGT